MGLWDRLRGRTALARQARAHELRHDYHAAACAYVEAGLPAEAARVKLHCARTAADEELALREFAHAVALAPAGSELQRSARREHALYVVAQHTSQPVHGRARHRLEQAAEELLQLEEHGHAAAAFRALGDLARQAEALQRGGQLEPLEALLEDELTQQQASRRRANALQRARDAMDLGERRDALSALTALRAEGTCSEHGARDLWRLENQRVLGSGCALELGNESLQLVLGAEPTFGRGERDAVRVHHPEVSRAHLHFARTPDGALWLHDPGSRHGTWLGAQRRLEPLPLLDAPQVLRLGAQFELTVQRAQLPHSPQVGVQLTLGSRRIWLALADLVEFTHGWQLTRGADGWLELHSHGAAIYRDGMQCAARCTLLHGDAFSIERDAAPWLRVRSLHHESGSHHAT